MSQSSAFFNPHPNALFPVQISVQMVLHFIVSGDTSLFLYSASSFYETEDIGFNLLYTHQHMYIINYKALEKM